MKRFYYLVFLVLACGCTANPYSTSVAPKSTSNLSMIVASGPKVDNELESLVMETLRAPDAKKPLWFDNALKSLTIDVTEGTVIFTHNNWLVFDSMDDLGTFAYFIIYAAAKSPELYYMVHNEYTELSKIQVVFPNDIGDIIMTLSGRTNIHAVADDYSRLDNLIEITKGNP